MSNKIDGSIIGELLLGELPDWNVGVCTLMVDEDENIVVHGEITHERISTDVWTHSSLDGRPVKDLGRIADEVNEAIRKEHEQL